MTDKPHIIERAYEIARSGEVRSTDELIQKLKAERYDDFRLHIAGRLRSDLRKLIKGRISPAG